MQLFGLTLPLTTVETEITQVGPACVWLKMDLGPFGRGILIHNLLPVHVDHVVIQQHWFTYPWLPTPLAKALVVIEAIQMERDIIVWNNKDYKSKPVFVKEDSTIAAHRRWYSQFYSEGSYRKKDQYNLDW